MKMLKWFARSSVALLNQMLFVDLEVGKLLYMLEFDHDDGISFEFSSILLLYHILSQR